MQRKTMQRWYWYTYNAGNIQGFYDLGSSYFRWNARIYRVFIHVRMWLDRSEAVKAEVQLRPDILHPLCRGRSRWLESRMRDYGRSRWTCSLVRINRGDRVLSSLHPEEQHESKVMRHKHASWGGSGTAITAQAGKEGKGFSSLWLSWMNYI